MVAARSRSIRGGASLHHSDPDWRQRSTVDEAAKQHATCEGTDDSYCWLASSVHLYEIVKTRATVNTPFGF